MPDTEEYDDIRASYLRFPRCTQHFWTWVTGKALPGQKPLWRLGWLSYLLITLSVFAAGLTLSSVAIVVKFQLWGAALVAGSFLTLAAARTMILVIAHQCIHKQFSGRRKIDDFCAELVTVLNIYQDADAFKSEHFDAHHRASVFATADDPPVQSLFHLGFLPGMSKAALWRRAWLVFVSPVFYLMGFWARLRGNLESGGLRRIGFLSWAGFWCSLPWWLPAGGQVLLLAFVVPIICLQQLSALLDRLGEHGWLTEPDPAHGKRFYHVSASWSRFCGARVPAKGTPFLAQILAWGKWSVAMLVYHMPIRFLVVVGDLPNHDFHHRYPASKDWMVAAYARQEDVDDGCRGGPAYIDVWGLGPAIDRMFDSLSGQEPAAARVVDRTDGLFS